MSVVSNKRFKVLIVQLIQRAFKLCLALTKFMFGNSIQAITVTFFVCVLAIQLHIIHMHTTNQVICLLFSTEAFKLSWLGKLPPQTKLACIILAEYTSNTIHCVGNIIALTVPTAQYICIFDQVQEHFQHICFVVKQECVVKLGYQFFGSRHAETFWRYSKCYKLIQPVQVYRNSSDRIEWIVCWRKAANFVKVYFNVKKCCL